MSLPCFKKRTHASMWYACWFSKANLSWKVNLVCSVHSRRPLVMCFMDLISWINITYTNYHFNAFIKTTRYIHHFGTNNLNYSLDIMLFWFLKFYMKYLTGTCWHDVNWLLVVTRGVAWLYGIFNSNSWCRFPFRFSLSHCFRNMLLV